MKLPTSRYRNTNRKLPQYTDIDRHDKCLSRHQGHNRQVMSVVFVCLYNVLQHTADHFAILLLYLEH